ncbi:MAG: hypothetical protein B6I18_02540 [Bacteroidetes bacterium 4572_112]|nr:MAG: hypothetical protein B6I18_02540 [Bacteroidetes bacterium 4572_112]
MAIIVIKMSWHDSSNLNFKDNWKICVYKEHQSFSNEEDFNITALESKLYSYIQQMNHLM